MTPKSVRPITLGLALQATVLLAQARPDATVAFTDVTAGAGLTMTYQPNPPMIPGVDEWVLGGLAVADFNKDGWPDLFVLAAGTGADRLYMNNGNGTFTNLALGWGIAVTHGGASVCTGDYDRNGWVDIYIASYGSSMANTGEPGKNRLYRNNGNGTFTETALAAGVAFLSPTTAAGNGCCFGDYDLDGDLDLAVAAWRVTAKGNRLFRNGGNGTFSNVSDVAITFPTTTWGFTPAFADMDGDGYPELLLAADFGTSRYYRNDAMGAFVDETSGSGTGLDEAGMGQCIGDFDNDGLLDWYVTSIFIPRPSPRWHNGNTLYRNLGGHAFSEIAATAGVDAGGWGWGAVAIDVDNDGWLDIAEVNGRNSTPWNTVPEKLWRNDGSGAFVEVPEQSLGFFVGDGRAVASIDFDRDGDQDLVMLFNNGPLKLYRNDTTGGGHWLQLKFETSANERVPPFGRLATVRATIGGETRMRVLDGGHGYGSGSEDLVQLGLGSATVIDELSIEFPPGYLLTFTDVAANQRLTVAAPSTGDISADGQVNGSDLGALLGAWGHVDSREGRVADFNGDGVVDGSDLGSLLGYWGQ